MRAFRSFGATTIKTPLSLPFRPMPRPWFSKSLVAYSSMPAEPSRLGTVATTTASPEAASSARIMRSIWAALSASTTLAKSLTGRVSSGRAGCAKMPTLSPATSHVARTDLRPGTFPTIYIRHELFDGHQVWRKELFGPLGGNLVDPGKRDHVGQPTG